MEGQREAMTRLLQSLFFPRDRVQSATNEDLVRALKRSRAFESANIEEALLAIPRAYFVTADLLQEAYVDMPLRFSRMGFNISAPHMHAMCLENMDIQPGDIVLDIGSGSGILSAYAAHLTGPTGHVYGVDLHDHIIQFSLDNIKKLAEERHYDLSNVSFIKRNCFLPVANPILYDRIHVGCCCPETKLQFLYALLKPGGVLVTPYGDELIRAKKDMSGNVTVKALVGVRYSDLTLPSDAEIKEAEREIKIARANSIVVLGESIQDNFGELYSNNYLSDIILFFSLSGEKIPAHSLILKMYSPYFVQLVESSRMEGETRVVTINDEPASFKCMLKFMYCGKWGKEQTLSEAQNLARKFGIVGDQDTSCQLIKRLNSLVASPRFSDITFRIADLQIPGHKLILQIRSEYFKNMLSSGFRESRDSFIDVHEATPEVFNSVLKFVYTGDCVIQENNYWTVSRRCVNNSGATTSTMRTQRQYYK
eukprot:TRINITY_DN3591_c0_g1_i7.p1 TRINITY_DN3591_c0_g1~~TRINITY_DN3591_c0_g1_i7.p1  ORF type:complete len:501 (+),score=59.78 TRINITY_DN3591_c0_g1_i7:66-1505(+)